MKGLQLYLKSRSVPQAFTTLLASTATLWGLSQLIDNQRLDNILALLAVAAGAITLAPGLAGADPQLDRTAAIAWTPRRAAHVIIGAAVITAALACTHVTDIAHTFRNVAGLTGLVALGAATLGASRAWFPPLAWTMALLPFTPTPGPAYHLALTWMIQPPSTTTITTAMALAAAGTITYSLRGPRT